MKCYDVNCNFLLFMKFTKEKILICFLAFSFLMIWVQCKNADESSQTNELALNSKWRNVYDTAAHYVGMEKCRSCHNDIYETYIKTGMGQSFDHATHQKSAADFSNHALVYDKDLDFYYKPYWENDSLFIKEYRLEGKDTVHQRVQKIDYIIGSGQHTNSHLFQTNGYFFQAPITFYTQKTKWDLAPGFEKGSSSRFSRLIEIECMTCHNGYPHFESSSQNKFLSVKTGIDCERCHGPGSFHVEEKMAGNIVDTAKTPDYSIVNPRRLSTELQNNICQRCHLQGIAVINEGKTFFDFRPGMKLKEVMNVFMPQYEGAENKMIMASHVERMKKSNCFIKSGKMSCITCHNPHVSVKFTPRNQYLSACQGCHLQAPQAVCSETELARKKNGNDCVICHMPKNGSIDIPHVAVTDHFIRKNIVQSKEQQKIKSFLGLKSFNNDSPEPMIIARAFMEFFERYNPNIGLIDSGFFYLKKQQQVSPKANLVKDYVRAYFLLKNYQQVVQQIKGVSSNQMNDAWTAYRIGESFFMQDDFNNALNWYKRATELKPLALDFQSKLATCFIALGQKTEAMKVIEKIISENPNHVAARTNGGFLLMDQGKNAMAYDWMKKAHNLDPDYEQNLINLAVWYHNNQQDELAKKTIVHLLKKHPNNEQAKMMMSQL